MSLWPINKCNFIDINVTSHKGWLLVAKDILSHFTNHVGHCSCIGQVVKEMFQHYEHFYQSTNVILLKLMSWIIKLTTSC
jgi:hypothetical protein